MTASIATLAALFTTGGRPVYAQQPALVRRELHDPAAQPMLDRYRRAVRAMQARPPWDPLSWWFWANIHGAPAEGDTLGCFAAECFERLFEPPANASPDVLRRIAVARSYAAGEVPIDATRLGVGRDRMWLKCPHGQIDFLPWHRIYLFFFERAAEAVLGEPFALPYWNYLDPRNRDMPAAFRGSQSADGSRNPLYWPDRSALAHDPNDPSVPADQRPLIRDVDLNWNTSAGQTFFERGDVFDLGRGFSFQLEQEPHGQVHVRIGTADSAGRPLGMATTALAARDPIFWLHHANLDRLWEWWRMQGTGGQDGPRDPIWLWSSEPYLFPGGQGGKVGLSAAESLAMVGTAYAYDALEPVPTPSPSPAAAAATPFDAQRMPTVVAQSTESLSISRTTGSVLLAPAPAPASSGGTRLAASPNQWVLRLTGVRADGPTAGSFDIILDAPSSAGDGAAAASFNVFGSGDHGLSAAHGTHGSQANSVRILDVTARVRELIAAGTAPDTIRVTVRPSRTAGTATLLVESLELVGR